MVTEPIEAPEVEEVPAPEVEEAPDVQFDEPSEPEAEEAPDPVAELKAQIAALEEKLASQPAPKSESEIAATLEERLRRQEEERARQRQQEQDDREELHDSIRATLMASGYSDVEPETVRKTAERFINKRYDQIANKEAGSVRNALVWLRDNFQNGRSDVVLSQRESGYASQLAESFNNIMQLMKEQATGDFIPKAELSRHVDAEIERRNAASRNGKKPLKSPEGAPADTLDRSLEAVTQRIISNQQDAEDEEIWNKRFRR